MKKSFALLKLGFLMILFTTCFISLAQKKPGYIPPSIDDNEEIPVVKTELPVPENGKDYVVQYFKGITDGVESRIAVKNLGYIIRPAMVQVISEDGRELAIELVKKNWDDVVRSGKTKDGKFQNSFKTAMEFGIKISAEEIGIPFIVAVSAGVELFPASNLFVDASTMRSTDENTDEVAMVEDESGQSNNIFLIIIAIALVGILVLLGVLVFKRKGKGAVNLILILFISYPANAGLVRGLGDSLSGKVATGIADWMITSTFNHYGNGGFSGDDPLSPDDKDFEPEPDPRGQPSLPSSCYEIARISASGFSSSVNDKEVQSGSKGLKEQMPNSNSNTNADLDEHGREVTDIMGREIEHDDFYHPKYDNNGDPIEYPEIDRPKFDKDGKPIEYQDMDRPKYDKDGKPIIYDENSNTPKPKFDSGGSEIEYDDDKKPVFDNNGNRIKYDDGNKPKYDKNGEPIKYPDAKNPKFDKNGKPIRYGSTVNRATSQGGFFSFFLDQEDEDSDQTDEGCDCLEAAYADLLKQRYSLEKLLKIGQHTKKVTDYGISFGDDFSGVHGVSGLVWQTQRAKVLKSIDKFDIVYNNKYKELLQKLYNVLIEIDECEKLLGYENWYSHSGFIYYEFMKARYASYK